MNATDSRTVLVTGGTARLGLAIANHLRSVGWRVITSSHRTDAGADVVADLSKPMGAAKLYAATLQMLGGLPPDALVNNAALFTGDDDAVESVGLVAPQKLTMMMAGRETGRGSVVNILDAALMSPHTSGDTCASPRYASSKRSLLEYTVKSAVMFAETLRVNAVAPGPVLAPEGVSEKAGETLVGRPTPDDVARAVAFLLDADATTGVILPVDCGQHLLMRSTITIELPRVWPGANM